MNGSSASDAFDAHGVVITIRRSLTYKLKLFRSDCRIAPKAGEAYTASPTSLLTSLVAAGDRISIKILVESMWPSPLPPAVAVPSRGSQRGAHQADLGTGGDVKRCPSGAIVDGGASRLAVEPPEFFTIPAGDALARDGRAGP